MDLLPKPDYKKLKKLRRKLTQINDKRHRLISERKQKGYSSSIGAKMESLRVEREFVYIKIKAIEDKYK